MNHSLFLLSPGLGEVTVKAHPTHPDTHTHTLVAYLPFTPPYPSLSPSLQPPPPLSLSVACMLMLRCSEQK